MTLLEIKNSNKTVLTPAEVAGVLCCDPNNIRFQANKDPSKLGFPISKIGSRIKIPREAFIKWFEGKEV